MCICLAVGCARVCVPCNGFSRADLLGPHSLAGRIFVFVLDSRNLLFPLPLLGGLAVTPWACFETGIYFLGGKGECLLDFAWGSSWFPDPGIFL